MMLSFRSIQRFISRFMGPPEKYLALNDVSHISTLLIAGIRPSKIWYKPSDQGMAELATQLISPGKDKSVKHLDLTHCDLSANALENVCRVLRFGSLESLTIPACTFSETDLFTLFTALRDNNGLKSFGAIGDYSSRGRNTLTRPLTLRLADIVECNKTIKEICLDRIAIEEEDRSIILKPYGEITDRPLPDIQISCFVNGASYPEHPKVNGTVLSERVDNTVNQTERDKHKIG